MDFQDVHILFCDHDPSSGSETLSLLRRCSYRVTAVKSACQVVETLKSDNSEVDIVLTDVELPQEKGFKMLKHILRQENLNHVAVVVMSEHDEMAVVAKCLHLGAMDYLVKPLRHNEILNLWTHMWRKRRMMGLPDKNVSFKRMNVSTNFQKPEMTVDLLSGYRNVESPTARPADIQHTAYSKDDELSLRLSLNYTAKKLPERAIKASLTPYQSAPEESPQPSAFSAYLKLRNVQPDEQSGTNAYSSSSSPSKRSKYSDERGAQDDWKLAGDTPAATSLSSPKDASIADETRPGDTDSQICDRSDQLPVDQVPLPCRATDERVATGQACVSNSEGFQQRYAFVGSSAIHMQQGVMANAQEVNSSGFSTNSAMNPSHAPQLPPFCHEGGMGNVPLLPNGFSYYPVAHLAVPVVNFSAWPTMVTPPPLVGGKLIQAERREAALSKFRMKRKGRCFEKKIRYASRKKLAEQRPRVRGQFVKRSALVETAEIEVMSEEEGEADDEQGCSELDNSSPDCIADNCRVG